MTSCVCMLLMHWIFLFILTNAMVFMLSLTNVFLLSLSDALMHWCLPNAFFFLLTSSVACSNNGIRLSGTMNNMQGRVEVCYQGRWGTVCGYSWDFRDAMVACRQLGRPYKCKRNVRKPLTERVLWCCLLCIYYLGHRTIMVSHVLEQSKHTVTV